MDYFKKSLEVHKKFKGKIAITSKVPVKTKDDLSVAYTPGVAEVCRKIASDKKNVFDYTIKQNTVAVVTDGSAVLGLGNIGPEAALPVMEGKCVLFKEFAGIDAFPICLDTQDEEEIVKTVKYIAPVFGGINLEDISAPRCFYIEEQLQDIGIPVMHDDQHGTATVILAALINASKVVKKDIEDLKIVINGAGSAGIAVTKMLMCVGSSKNICTSVKEVVLCDSHGIIYSGRDNLNDYKKKISDITNLRNRKGDLNDALEGADVFIGVSVGNTVNQKMLKSMNEKPIVFAMANPVPEIMPDDAKKAGAAVVGTGRSDLPNQINNALAYPGIFRGALDAKATKITMEMKLAAAHALAGCVSKPNAEKIIPSPLDKEVHRNVALAVKNKALKN